jgi:hypothetical protein
MSPSVTRAHHIARNDHRNGLDPTGGAPRLPSRIPDESAAPRRLEVDVLSPLEPQDLSGLIGGGDLKTQSFDDPARLQDLGGV